MKFPNQIFYVIAILVCSFLVTHNLFAQVEFIENNGQWDPSVKFKSNAGSGAFYLTNKGFTIVQYNPKDIQNIKIRRHDGTSLDAKQRLQPGPVDTSNKVRTHSYSMEFLNSQVAQIIPDRALPNVNNYFLGNDKSKWASNCKIYLGVTYQNVYKGIDVRYYVDGNGNLKYDFIVHPGANVDNISMKYSGASNITVKKKELHITTPLGVSRELKPYTYQLNNNERQELDCRYEVKGDVVKFKVKNYSPDKTMIIDPTEIFFSYSGSVPDNWGFTATYGPDGSFYGGGIVFGEGIPWSSGGGYDQTYNGDFDIGIIKLTPNGRNMVYTTYLGGSGEDQPHSLIVDSKGELILAGRSNSDNYPTTNTFGPNGGWDIVVSKLSASGGALLGSLKIGGTGQDGVNIADEESGSGTQSLKRNYGDDARSEVVLDASDNIYVASCTSSPNFPTTPGAFQATIGGLQDAVVLKLDPTCNSVIFSTFLGGSQNDAAYVLALGDNNDIYIGGGTASSDFQGVTKAGVLNPNYLGGVCDGFVTEMNNSGTAVIRGTYLGTAQADQVYGIETDISGNVYAMGTSEGSMQVINAKYFNNGAKQFITKLQPDLSAVIYQTTFGSVNALLPNISPTAFLVDRCQNVYVSGWGGKSNQGTGFGSGNTKGMATTSNAIKPVTDASGSDFYFFVMKRDADSLLYGTFFGQEDPPLSVKNPDTFGDHVDGGTSRFDRNGVIYQAMCANCFETVTFNGTPGAWSTTNKSQGNNGRCNLGMLKIEMDFSGVSAGLKSTIDGKANDTSGCIPLLVNFTDTLMKGKTYYWYFGDGTGDTTTAPAANHTYTNVGLYHVMLVSIDSSTCNISDTSYGIIKAGNNKALLNFIPQKLPPCTSLSYSFTNTSTSTSGAFAPNIFTWNFGDNSPLVTQSQNPPITHAYAAPGTYNVTLTINDSTYCNSPDDTLKTIRLSPNLVASFSTPPAGCAPYNAVFINNSLGGLNFTWDFGDGTTSTEDNPTHLYTQVGTYKVTLTAYDSTACNKIDDTSFTITISPNPTASFNYTPNPPKENTFTTFVNQSSGAISYLWNFGDGDTSTLTNPTHLFGSSGTFNVCLQATNQYGCMADTCESVAALIRPLVDVPSAFTPGKFGVNSSIRVVGFGISQMQWSIYNRWGQRVFETTSTKGAWDGTFEGKPQPMDVYAYTLAVIFSDGKKYTKTGDITLLR